MGLQNLFDKYAADKVESFLNKFVELERDQQIEGDNAMKNLGFGTRSSGFGLSSG